VTHVVLFRAIAKLGGEDVDQLAAPPPLLAVRVVFPVVGLDATKTVLKIVRLR
jgi:hypothetical protein